jgi:hypothetical protein
MNKLYPDRLCLFAGCRFGRDGQIHGFGRSDETSVTGFNSEWHYGVGSGGNSWPLIGKTKATEPPRGLLHGAWVEPRHRLYSGLLPGTVPVDWQSVLA